MPAGFGGVRCEYVACMYKVTSKITFDVLYFYEKRRSDVFHSKIDLRMAPKECQSQIQYFLFFFLFFFLLVLTKYGIIYCRNVGIFKQNKKK